MLEEIVVGVVLGVELGMRHSEWSEESLGPNGFSGSNCCLLRVVGLVSVIMSVAKNL